MLAVQLPDACSGPSANEEIPDTNPGRDIEPANRVLEGPSEFYGTVSVVGGEVSEVLSSAAFVISEGDGRAPDQGPEGVLVVNSSRQAPTPELSVG